MTYYTPPGDSVSPLTNPAMQRPATHRPEDYDEDDGSDSLERIGELRFGTSREDYEHNHPTSDATWVMVGWSDKAPGHHLWRCSASHDCPATMIVQCGLLRPNCKECSICEPQ